MHTFRILWSLPLTALAAWSPSLRAQGADPMREIQEIARRVDEQLQEIDRLLLESGRKGQSRSKPKEMLQQARERSVTVEDGIDKLIEKLNEMKQQGGGGSSQDQQNQDQNQDQDQPADGQQQGRQQNQRNRRENQTPDFQPRQQGKQQGQEPGQQPGQEQQGQGQQPQPKPGEGQPQPSGGDPKGGQENPDGGANTRGNRQHEPETGPGSPGTGDGSWGDLQPYMNFLRNRGSQPPAVPEKFRKYWEAYLKQKQGGGAGGGK